MPWFEESCECEWVVCKLYTPPISIIGLKPLRLVGIVPAAGLAQGIGPLGAVRVPAGTELPAGTVPARGIGRAEAVLSAPGTGRAEVPAGTELAGTGPVRGIVRPGAVLSAPGTGPVAGTGRPWAGRGIGPAGIGRLGAGLSCGCS